MQFKKYPNCYKRALTLDVLKHPNLMYLRNMANIQIGALCSIDPAPSKCQSNSVRVVQRARCHTLSARVFLTCRSENILHQSVVRKLTPIDAIIFTLQRIEIASATKRELVLFLFLMRFSERWKLTARQFYTHALANKSSSSEQLDLVQYVKAEWWWLGQLAMTV